MLSKLLLALLVAVVTTLGCILLGAILALIPLAIVGVIAVFLTAWSVAIGVIAGLWYFLTR